MNQWNQTNQLFSWVVMMISNLCFVNIFWFTGCTNEIRSLKGTQVESSKEPQQDIRSMSLSPIENNCTGIIGDIPWTVVDGVQEVSSRCDQGEDKNDTYENVKMYICSEGQVIDVGQFRGRLLSVGDCSHSGPKCGDANEGQLRNRFTFDSASYACPQDSLGAIVVTYMNRITETCDSGTWNSGGVQSRTIYQVDDSTCAIKPPVGQNCGERYPNESWQETTEENSKKSCAADESGELDFKRSINQSFICLNGTVSRTAYTVSEWNQLPNSECNKNCPQVDLNHGGIRSSQHTESEVIACDSSSTGQITHERVVTDSILCTNGVVDHKVEYSEWKILQSNCKKKCSDGHLSGDTWTQMTSEKKTESCASGYSGEIQYQKNNTLKLSCNDGSISEQLIPGDWFEISNTCKKMCEGGKKDGERWSTSSQETQTLNCPTGYEGTKTQERTAITSYLCTAGSVSSTVTYGNWSDKINSCIQLCPSGHKEGETWDKEIDGQESKSCPTNQIGEIVINTHNVEHYICQGGADHLVKKEEISRTENNKCTPFSIHGRCSKDFIYATEVPGRRGWVRKCKELPAIRYFYEIGGESLYTHRNHYPTFGYIAHNKAVKSWHAPVSVKEPCLIPDDVRILGLCTSGCFTEDQKILFSQNNYQPIKSAMESNLKEVMVIKPGSVLEHLSFISEKIDHFMTDILPSTQTIYEFHTQGGGSIQVTDSHPMLTAHGRLVDARSLKVGDSLIKYNGTEDQITEINKFDIYGYVYNLYPQSQNLQKNLILAQGFITGSAYYQNEGNEYLGRVILRHALVSDLFPETTPSHSAQNNVRKNK